MNKKSIYIILIGLLLIIVSVSIIMLNNKKEINYSGIYENDKCNIYVYYSDNKEIIFFADNLSEFVGKSKIEDDIAHANVYGEEIDLIFDEESLEFASKKKNHECDGKYNKTKEITLDEYNAKQTFDLLEEFLPRFGNKNHSIYFDILEKFVDVDYIEQKIPELSIKNLDLSSIIDFK